MEQKNFDISSLNRYGSGEFGTAWLLAVGSGVVIVALIAGLVLLDSN